MNRQHLLREFPPFPAATHIYRQQTEFRRYEERQVEQDPAFTAIASAMEAYNLDASQ